MPTDPTKPGDGLLGWLGRQIGYVSKAVKTDVTQLPASGSPIILHRNVSVTESSLPGSPDILLRRTTIDEAIIDQGSKDI